MAQTSLWRSHPALASLILPSGATHPAAQDTHCGLGFARGTESAQVLPTVLRHVQTLLLLCVTLADKQCSANLTAAITLQLIIGTFTVAVVVQRG